jgi:biopolymer transport protein ExbB
MKKLIALFMLSGILMFPVITKAQDAEEQVAAEETTEVVEEVVQATPTVVDDEIIEEEKGFHQVIKEKFIEGDPTFMSPVLICLILGLAVALERIITLNLSTTNTKKTFS